MSPGMNTVSSGSVGEVVGSVGLVVIPGSEGPVSSGSEGLVAGPLCVAEGGLSMPVSDGSVEVVWDAEGVVGCVGTTFILSAYHASVRQSMIARIMINITSFFRIIGISFLLWFLTRLGKTPYPASCLNL